MWYAFLLHVSARFLLERQGGVEFFVFPGVSKQMYSNMLQPQPRRYVVEEMCEQEKHWLCQNVWCLHPV
jgi:hypothetical protein